VGDPEGAVWQCDQAFRVVAVGVGRQDIAVNVQNGFAGVGLRVHPTGVGQAARVGQRDDLFQDGHAVDQLELANGRVERRDWLDVFGDRGIIDVGATVRQAVKLVGTARYRVHR